MEIQYRTQFGELLEHFGLKGDAAEIGVAEARHSQVLISQPAITKLYMIDNWATLNQAGDGGHPQSWHDGNYNEAHERVEAWREKAVILRGMSTEMIKQIPDNSLVLSYIDCDHSYEGFMQDLLNVLPKVIVGGIVSGHDVKNPQYGVGKALEDWVIRYNYLSGAYGGEKIEIHYTEEDGDQSMVSFWFIKK